MKNSIIAQAPIDFGYLQKQALPSLNPKLIPSIESSAGKIGGIISYIIPYIFVFAGLILLFILISGGLQMMANASDEKAAKDAKTKITSALTGFILLFCSYWIFRIVLKILGIEGF